MPKKKLPTTSIPTPTPSDRPDKEDGSYHVVPINDLYEHIVSSNCWCRPTRDCEEHNVWVHNSADGREETYEKGNLQ